MQVQAAALRDDLQPSIPRCHRLRARPRRAQPSFHHLFIVGSCRCHRGGRSSTA
jgi:hypothetical protein